MALKIAIGYIYIYIYINQSNVINRHAQLGAEICNFTVAYTVGENTQVLIVYSGHSSDIFVKSDLFL